MKRLIIFSIVLIAAAAAVVSGQTTWLDRPIDRNWNSGNGVVPNAPRNAGRIEAMCQGEIRPAESIADRAVTRSGWFLYGAAQVYGSVTLVTAMAGVDGMCRPNEYNAFVFVANRFAGTLAPTTSGARSDGSLSYATLAGRNRIYAEYSRYSEDDALCCPSGTSRVDYKISDGARPVVSVEDVTTDRNCRDSGGIETMDNVVSGTVTYRQRSSLPSGAVLTVKIVDVSRQDVSSTVIAEQRIETAGKQVPFLFDIAYDRSKIQERNNYAVQAEIRDGGRLLFITDTSYPVITQGNPRSVEITVVPVGAGGGGIRTGVIRGTVTYLQRIALPPNSEISVRLVDTSDPTAPASAETTFSAGNRQVPIPFELRFDPRDINRQRNYELRAEIRSGNTVRFKTQTGKPIAIRGNEVENVELIVAPGSDGPEAVTGRNISLSKFGTGSIKIGNRNSQFLIRGSVSVRNDGTAEVTVSSLEGTYNFTGKLTSFSNSLLKITVSSSGDADAGGEIEVSYSGRTLRNLTGVNLLLDGQEVVLRF